MVPLDHGELQYIALGIADGAARHNPGAFDQVLRIDLIQHLADDADFLAACRDGEIE